VPTGRHGDPSHVRQVNFVERRKSEVQTGENLLCTQGAKASSQLLANPSMSSRTKGAAPPRHLICNASSSWRLLWMSRERWAS
jgi:hypothetical protein